MIDERQRKLLEKSDNLIIELTLAANRDWAKRLNYDESADPSESVFEVMDKYGGFLNMFDFNFVAEHIEMGMSVVKFGDEYFGTAVEFGDCLRELGYADEDMSNNVGILSRKGETRVILEDGEVRMASYVSSPSYRRKTYLRNCNDIKELLAAYDEEVLDESLGKFNVANCMRQLMKL